METTNGAGREYPVFERIKHLDDARGPCMLSGKVVSWENEMLKE